MTNKVLAQLTALHRVSNVALFSFDGDAPNDTGSTHNDTSFPKCKSLPGDLTYPSQDDWTSLNVLSDGALIKTIPIGAVCYDGEVYDSRKCQFLLDNWNVSDTQ